MTAPVAGPTHIVLLQMKVFLWNSARKVIALPLKVNFPSRLDFLLNNYDVVQGFEKALL